MARRSSLFDFSNRLICLDPVMVDVALHIVDLPSRGGDVPSRRRLVTAGGGFNVMSAAARQGMEVVYAGQLGSGSFANIARHAVAAEEIGAPVPANPDCDLGTCIVLVEASGERTFVTSPGAELTLDPLDLETIYFGPGDIAYVSGYNFVYDDLAPVVANWLDALPAEVCVAFDPGPRAMDIAPALREQVLRRSNWLLCNALEALHLSEHSELSEAAADLYGRYELEGVVVRNGAAGCLAVTATSECTSPGFPVEVVDTNGAGDVHNGIVLANVAQGAPLGVALLRANAGASVAVSTFGPATCPMGDIIDEMLVSTTLVTQCHERS